jgi:hypothetical protein
MAAALAITLAGCRRGRRQPGDQRRVVGVQAHVADPTDGIIGTHNPAAPSLFLNVAF